jgi:light-regulated signal transduction histidine kinase (bacteriophytochrome)
MFENIVASIPTPLLVLDESLNIRQANCAFLRMFQLETSQIMGFPILTVDNQRWNVPAIRHLFEALSSAQTGFEDAEVEQEFPQLGLRRILLNGRVIAQSTSEDPLYLIAMEDVTQRRRDEGLARELSQHLQRSNVELEEFAQVAAHDLQEPLRKIQAFGSRLTAQLGDSMPPGAIDSLDRITKASLRMQVLIGDLLAFSRLGAHRLGDQSVDMDNVVRDVIRDLDLRIAEAQATVVIDGDLPTVKGDRLQMGQLFQNLLTNALKYRRSDVACQIGISSIAGDNAEHCRIAVKDNGIGFEMKYADKIFGIFERLHPRSTYEGTGIGLALCRKIVQSHGGAITAESDLSSGSTFIVSLPLAQQVLH